MKKTYRVSAADVTLPYWQAEIAFGEDALNKVLARLPWREQFPNLAERSRSSDIAVMRIANDTILPGELLYEVAECEECENDFFADPDGIRLYSAEHNAPTASSWTFPQISTQDTLLEYGAYALFYSVDNILGSKGQRDPSRHYPDLPQ